MIKRVIPLLDAKALTPPLAQELARTAMRYSSRVMLEDQRGTFNGKSMLGLLSLGRFAGERLTLLVEGEDEQEAADILEAMLLKAISPS